VRVVKSLLMLLSAVGIGTTGLPSSTSAQFNARLLEEEECQRALDARTIEALDEFLRRYPDSNCRYRALDALRAFGPRDDVGEVDFFTGASRYGQ
jgi:hypothetical protein